MLIKKKKKLASLALSISGGAGLRQLTCLRHHSPDPRTKMIHLAHTASQLAGMMRAIWLPVLALRTPFRPTINLANENLLAVKGLEPGAVGTKIGRSPRWLLYVPATAVPFASCLFVRLAFDVRSC